MPRPLQPIRRFLDLFSSVWLGVILLTILFFYCSVGSAGVLYPTSLNIFDLDNWDQVVPRQHFSVFGLLTIRPEKTEYEWFVWWPFNLLIGLICLNLVVVTIRRIRLKLTNLGVWMIHTGIIILALGSVWYFSTKVEGDSPVFRRKIVIQTSGMKEPRSLVALPGNRLTVSGQGGDYQFQVVDVDPAWEILTGDDVGKKVYSVMVRIVTPQNTFVRQLLANYPQYTEDVIPGEGRAIKVTGERLVDASINLTLDYAAQDWFYLIQTDALYLREVGDLEWVERPIHNLPRYSEYLTSRDEVWLPASMRGLELHPLGIAVGPVSNDDPLPGMTFRIGSYTRYAVPQVRLAQGGNRLDPFLRVRVESANNDPTTIQMRAFDSTTNDVDPQIGRFDWINDESKLTELRAGGAGQLTIAIPEVGAMETIRFADLQLDTPNFRDIGDTGYAVRVREVRDRMRATPEDEPVSFAIVDVRTPDREFNRWVFDDPRLNRDQVANDETGVMEMVDTDDSIQISYKPPPERPLFHFIAGPRDSDLRVIMNTTAGVDGQVFALSDGTTTEVFPGLAFHVEDYWPRTRDIVKPAVVPPEQRDRNSDMRLRMIRLELPGKDKPVSVWLRSHDFPFASADAAMRGYLYEPKHITIRDGDEVREIELMFSRRRARLPATVVLDDFIVDWHVGGFTGETASVQNWYSELRFADADNWSDINQVAVNEPAEYSGFWFFQKAWDPPDTSGSRTGAGGARWNGLNYTVLGVGNRNGVYVQLLGCIVAVTGMLFAFYVKPVLKRRQRASVYAAVQADGDNGTETVNDLNRRRGSQRVHARDHHSEARTS